MLARQQPRDCERAAAARDARGAHQRPTDAIAANSIELIDSAIEAAVAADLDRPGDDSSPVEAAHEQTVAHVAKLRREAADVTAAAQRARHQAAEREEAMRRSAAVEAEAAAAKQQPSSLDNEVVLRSRFRCRDWGLLRSRSSRRAAAVADNFDLDAALAAMGPSPAHVATGAMTATPDAAPCADLTKGVVAGIVAAIVAVEEHSLAVTISGELVISAVG